jgi:arginyl-tRNA synthetase
VSSVSADLTVLPLPAAAAAALLHALDVVEELKEKGVAEVSDGATCVFVEGCEVPLIVQKSDGGYGYASTDMAAIKQRITQEKADWVIYVTDIGQAPHFDMVFAAARRAGWLPEKGSSQVRGLLSSRHVAPA